MKERSCIHPFIEATQKAFQRGESFISVWHYIKKYQNIGRLITDISPGGGISHVIGMSVGGLGIIVIWEYARAHNIPLPDSKTIISLLPVVSITPQNGYLDENAPVWQYGRSQGLDGEELRKKVDEHRKAGHAQFDSYLEQGLITPGKAEEGKKSWDQKHGYRS